MTRQQIADLISEVSDLAATLRGAESETAAEACRQLGLRLTYHPDKQTVRAAAAPQPGNIGKWLVSEGRMHPKSQCVFAGESAVWEPTVTAGADLWIRWIRWITSVCVALPALIAGIVSYLTPDYI
jgi:hypothetical protein